MTSRLIISIALATVMLAACGGDSDGSDSTLPEITLLTTTSEAPLFEETATTDETEPSAPSADGTTPAAGDETDATPGTDVAVTTLAPAPTDPPPTTQAPDPSGGPFVLGADGLGAIKFGADPDQAITFVTSIYGAPTSDTGWVPPFDIGPCGGTQVRQVSWNQLQLEFGDVSDVTEGIDHFYAYYYGAEGSTTPTPAGLSTAEKVGPGSTVADLIAAYPGVKLFQADDFVGPSFQVNDSLSGRLGGLADDDLVEAVIGGLPCDG